MARLTEGSLRIWTRLWQRHSLASPQAQCASPRRSGCVGVLTTPTSLFGIGVRQAYEYYTTTNKEPLGKKLIVRPHFPAYFVVLIAIFW